MLLVTGNLHKKEEFQRLLPTFNWQTLGEWAKNHQQEMIDIDETGQSFAENAIIKAKAGWQQSGEVCIADDSGLCVDYLDGAPGIYSARYVKGSSEDRYLALLNALEGVPPEKRRASFHCALAICGLNNDQKKLIKDMLPLPHITWQDECLVAFGKCQGRIRLTPFGAGGFGYDPIFNLEDGRSFASISGKEKDNFSHRGNALRNLMQVGEIFS